MKSLIKQDIRFSTAPMMDWTDRHCRFFHRLLSRRARLYTEMLTTGAVIFGDRERLLGFDAAERPLALQLGGSDPAELAKAARIAETFGYDEINLNVGCPSDRVQNGAFGACLMLRPELVADCVKAMKDAVALPITVKCRIGVDDQEPRTALFALAERAVAAGSDALFVHARKAWLSGLSPKENRDVPPLDYGLVYELKRAYSDLPIAINGGIATIDDMRGHLSHVDGVMIGRAAYHEPELLLSVDPELFGEAAPLADGFAAVEAFIPYIEAQIERGERLANMTRHMLGLFAGKPGARAFRRRLASEAVRPGAGVEVLLSAMDEARRAMSARIRLAADANPTGHSRS
ncbi:tRNA dihydrouridine(20/20a) synthase DusA [Methylosinus sp. Ce-a6]|uniref:tRNA dihydrouridine(20/20a) synthase DusA n=1 Tax=Methylosinus sp. Ce-a6 TaxID=2172005 RepID=UPI00135BE386|nr:tRNA dihydrouridine(20/20a) synthase DusA [Methylosinus sp. Ce-a6]